MIVRTWSLSRIDLNRGNLIPWLTGWALALLRPIETVRVWRKPNIHMHTCPVCAAEYVCEYANCTTAQLPCAAHRN